jgi:hypothetical protein
MLNIFCLMPFSEEVRGVRGDVMGINDALTLFLQDV